MKRIASIFMMSVLCATTVFASASVPKDVERQNIDGTEYITKTFEATTDIESESLIESDFTDGGFLFSYETVEKVENEGTTIKAVTESEVVETQSDQLEDIIRLFPQTKPYDADGFTGELTLNANSITTEAIGYETSYYTITDTKEIPGLMYPDPSYVPQTSLKNGTTLPLTDIQFDVMATSLSGDSLVPTEYKAVGTYSKTFSKQVPTGYTSKAIYEGEVSKNQVDTVTYIITYVGTKMDDGLPSYLIAISCVGGLLILGGLGLLGFLYLKSKKGVDIYNLIDGEYFCLGKQSIDVKNPLVDLNEFEDMIQSHTFRFILDKKVAKELYGRNISITLKDMTVKHMVKKRNQEYEFELDMGGVLDVE
ncbi:hypothetical protein [Chakrabartyella piscis]|uniref:hypothetical protein n=1 Tax=Chakrabartyella piscis TaxID=2918914 RepID=UPI00295835ED|nr:hypothetical protein [Chakrabartyella piscis]